MRVVENTVVDGYVSDTTEYSEQQLEHTMCYSCQVTWTSTTSSYTVKLQGSNDSSNWVDLSGLTQSIANNSGGVLWNVADAGYKGVRAVATKSSGSLTNLKIKFYCKGF